MSVEGDGVNPFSTQNELARGPGTNEQNENLEIMVKDDYWTESKVNVARGNDTSQVEEQENEMKQMDDLGRGKVIWGVNMLHHSNIGHAFEIFGEESIVAFDDWADRFKDSLAVLGKNWTEEDKVTRLKLALKDTPKALFKELTPAQTTTVNQALRALRTKLDSPQRREITKSASDLQTKG